MHPLGDIVKEFLLETHENLDRLDQDFVKLEQSPGDRETLAAIFRVVHTLKSSSAFLGFNRLEKLAHAGEHLLGRLRDGRLSFDPAIADTLLTSVDRLRAMVREVESRNSDGDGDDTTLIATLQALADGRPLPQVAVGAAPARGAVPATPAPLDELTREFLIETTENLDALDRSFVQLEKDPGNREVLAAIFRTVHTIKGTSGFFGFSRLEKLGHAAENLLGRLRTGEMALAPEMTDVLLDAADAIRAVLQHVESTGHEPDADHRDLIECLNQLAGVTASATALSRPHTELRPAPSSLLSVRRAPAEPAHGATRAQPARTTTPASKPASATPPTSSADARGPSIADTSIRVDVGQLDKLMNLVGELVLARNRLMPFAANHPDTAFVAATQVLNQITSELQERVMKTRMQPVSNLWSKLPRLVRDVAAQCGKQVVLEFEGQETELDRSLLEAIRDPLTHIVRNAVDHGIESPARRDEAGKPVAGRLHLRAFHEGGQVVMEICDDGAGIDLGRVRAKAVEKGLLSAAVAGALNERQAMELIFLPGFSTADKATTVSGRGVGMDVVKTNIENIGGSLDVQSRPGQGTTLRLKVPLTLAIIPALLVGCCGERFAIPQTGLVELIRLGGETEGGGIEMVYGAPVVRLRGKLLPLVFLANELQLTSTPTDGNGSGTHSARKRTINIVVLQAESHRFGVVVDEVHDTEEIVVKPLGSLLKGVPCFAGCTILGDGRVALILDVVGLALHSGVVEKIRDKAFGDDEPEPEKQASALEQSLLLFDMGVGERMAIPIERVTRLERFPVGHIENTGGGTVAKYHGQILPIVRANELIAGNAQPPEPEDGLFDVVVISDRDRRVGLVVGRIHDIVSEPLTLQPWVGRRGLLGSAIVQNQVTSLVDVPAILREAAHLPNGDPETLP